MLLANNSGGSSQKEYVDSLFSTYLYTGNGSTQTINNGIDLVGEGGMVWIKNRTNSGSQHAVYDTARGANRRIIPNLNNSEANDGSLGVSFSSSGFALGGNNSQININGEAHVSWTFRKAPKFFDVVTYTGTGTQQTINHNLGATPGFIVTKRTDASGHWRVWTNALTVNEYLTLNDTVGKATFSGVWGTTAPNATQFQVGTGTDNNSNGGTYVAYLFAHDPSADGIIQCGSYVGNSTLDAGPIVNLGWEPQFVLLKNASGTGDWFLHDTMRGMPVGFGGTGNGTLRANTSAVEENVGNNPISPTATGFQIRTSGIGWNSSGSTYIYLAIRRPNKPPTSATEVYNATTATPSGDSILDIGLNPDLMFAKPLRDSENIITVGDRLRGNTLRLYTSSTAAEETGTMPECIGFRNNTFRYQNNTLSSFIAWAFRRAPGFFSSFAYTGTGANRTTPHDLAATPDLLIVKSRSAATDWQVWCNALAANEKLVLNSNAGKVTDATAWNSTLPTSTNISLGTASATNANTATFIAYAFSNLSGIQKIGTYIGDGTSGRVIDCGFSTGARFVCIKAISTTGSWLVSDSARGIVSGNDPYLQLNSTAAEVTTEDWLDPTSSGFIVNNVASSNANTNGVTYMFWAIS